jgi:hypothetical protein
MDIFWRANARLAEIQRISLMVLAAYVCPTTLSQKSYDD